MISPGVNRSKKETVFPATKWAFNGLDPSSFVFAEFDGVFGLVPEEDYEFPQGFSDYEPLLSNDYRFLSTISPSEYLRWRYPAARMMVVGVYEGTVNDVSLMIPEDPSPLKRAGAVVELSGTLSKHLVYGNIQEKIEEDKKGLLAKWKDFLFSVAIALETLQEDGIFLHPMPLNTRILTEFVKVTQELLGGEIILFSPAVSEETWLYVKRKSTPRQVERPGQLLTCPEWVFELEEKLLTGKYTTFFKEEKLSIRPLQSQWKGVENGQIQASIDWSLPGPIEASPPTEMTLRFSVGVVESTGRHSFTMILAQPQNKDDEGVIKEHIKKTFSRLIKGSVYEKRGVSLPGRLWEEKDLLDVIVEKGLLSHYERHRNSIFPLDRKGSNKFWNRAGDKLYQVMQATRILPAKRGNTKGRGEFHEGDEYHFVDLCGGPGAFSQVLLSLSGKKSHGWGMTLKDSGEERSIWYKELLKDKRFTAYWGPRGDGDIYQLENIDGLVDLVEKKKSLPVRYVVADGGFALHGHDDIQESVSSRLILCEFYGALRLLDLEGNFVCKLFDTFTDFTLSLILLTANCFQETFVVKPKRSRSINSERYLVGRGFLGATDGILTLLRTAVEACAKEERFIPDTLVPESRLREEAFFQTVLNSVYTIGERQVVSLSMVTESLFRDYEVLEAL